MRAIVPAAGLAALIDRFDGLIIDQGVIIRDEVSLHPGALDALERLQSRGIRSIILAASGSDQANINRLEALGVERQLYERLVSTGQLLQQALVAQSLDSANAGRRYFVVGSPEAIAGRLLRADRVADADAVMLLELSAAETADPGRLSWLTEAADRRLPLYASRADVSEPVARGELTAGFALVLNAYRARGGEVLLFGKPSGRVYARCLNLLDPIESKRIGSIGEQFPADIFGAREMGIEPIFVGSGAGGLVDDSPAAIEAWHIEMARLCDSYGIFELSVVPGFAW